MMSWIRIGIKLFKTRTIALIAVGYLLFLQLIIMGVVVESKPLNGAETGADFPFPMPIDETKLSLFPGVPCNCGEQRGDGNNNDGGGGFVPSDKFPFELGPNSMKGSEQEHKNDLDTELIISKKTPRVEKSLDPAKKEIEDPNVIKQVIFIEPPEYVYKHDIKVRRSQDSKQPRTVIYVFPPMVKHIYNITDKTDLSNLREEPKVYYLGAKQHFDDESDDRQKEENRLELEMAGKSQVLSNDNKYIEIDQTQFNENPRKHLSLPPMKRNSQIAEESRQIYNYEQDNVQDHKITQRQSSSSSRKYSPFLASLPISSTTTTTTSPPKQYRRFDYFSKTDYDKLKSAGKLSSNMVQYKSGRIVEPNPSSNSNFTQGPIKTFTYTSSSSRQFNYFPSTTTTPRPFIAPSVESAAKSPKAPSVNLQYEKLNHTIPMYYDGLEGSLNPPPLPTNDAHPLQEWQWGHVAKADHSNDTVKEHQSDQHLPSDYSSQNSQIKFFDESRPVTKQPLQFQTNDTTPTLTPSKSGSIKFPDSKEEARSKLEPRNNFKLIPAVIQNYVYVGPAGPNASI